VKKKNLVTLYCECGEPVQADEEAIGVRCRKCIDAICGGGAKRMVKVDGRAMWEWHPSGKLEPYVDPKEIEAARAKIAEKKAKGTEQFKKFIDAAVVTESE